MTPQAREIIKAVAAERGVNPASITAPCRIKKVWRARMEVAKRLAARGYSSTKIGAILNHDHTTILFYLSNTSKPRWRKPRIQHLHLNSYPCKHCYFPEGEPEAPPKPSPRIFPLPYAGKEAR